MISMLIVFLCRIEYRKYKKPILYIKGTEESYPRYLLYTENENVYHRMDKF